jgi:hypothetical protein
MTGLHIIDIADLSDPVRVGGLTLAGAGSLALQYPIAYMLGGSDLKVIDVSEPSMPRVIVRIPLEGGGVQLLELDQKLYVTTWLQRILVFDLSDPSSPRLIQQVSSRGMIRELVGSGRHLYTSVSGRYGVADGVEAFLVTGGGSLTQVGFIDVDIYTLRRIAALGDYLYITDSSGLRVYGQTFGKSDRPGSARLTGSPLRIAGCVVASGGDTVKVAPADPGQCNEPLHPCRGSGS